MSKFIKDLSGAALLVAAFVYLTIDLTKSPDPHIHLILYHCIVILSFLFYSVMGAVITALISTFAAIAVLMITGEWIALPAMGAYWLTAVIANSFFDEVNRSRGKFQLELENREKELGILYSKKEQYEDELPVLREKLSRYLVLSEVSLKLTTTLKQERIYSIIKEYLKQIFPGKKIIITTGEGNEYSRWVKSKGSSLLVGNIGKDYRFSTQDQDFVSLIECPLLRRQEVFGTLRVESGEEMFSPQDLRMLGTVAAISTIALGKARLFSRIQELSVRDSLTGLFTHKYFKERIDEEIRRSARFKEEFSLLMMDIDKFKDFNDYFGHRAGDRVLKKVAAAVKESVRETDIVGRYGGEEFSVLLLNIQKEDAREIAENIRKKIEGLHFDFDGKEVGVTVTIGGSSFPENPTGEAILKNADQAMYKGKRSGRNKVVFK